MTQSLDVNAVNDLISGKQSIKIGIDTMDIIILASAIFLAVVLAGVAIKILTKNIGK